MAAISFEFGGVRVWASRGINLHKLPESLRYLAIYLPILPRSPCSFGELLAGTHLVASAALWIIGGGWWEVSFGGCLIPPALPPSCHFHLQSKHRLKRKHVSSFSPIVGCFLLILHWVVEWFPLIAGKCVRECIWSWFALDAINRRVLAGFSALNGCFAQISAIINQITHNSNTNEPLFFITKTTHIYWLAQPSKVSSPNISWHFHWAPRPFTLLVCGKRQNVPIIDTW